MKAKKKPLDTLTPADLGVTLRPRVKALRFEAPAPRQKGVVVKDVAELVAQLKNRGLV
jgi:electron transfer flavoprotein beta subunit